MYTVALLGFKIALLSSYLRIGGFVKKFRIIIIVIIAVCVVNQLIFTFLLSLACRPVGACTNISYQPEGGRGAR